MTTHLEHPIVGFTAAWNRTPLRRAAILLCCVVMLLPPAFIARSVQPSDPKLDGALKALDQLKRIDASWSADSLRLSAGLITNYDPLSRPIPQAASNESVLHAVASDADMAPQRFEALFQRFRDDMATKIELLERLKSQQSILGNSLRFLPTSHIELSDAARSVSDPAGRQVTAVANSLLALGMDFQREPRADVRASMEDKLRTLAALTASWPADLRPAVDAVVAHTRVAMEQRQFGDVLLRRLLAVPTLADLDAMDDALRLHRSEFAQRQANYKIAIVAYVGLLLASLGIGGWLLARSYRKLNDSHASLRQATDEAHLQLVQSAKMSAMGRMAAGLAHEINTPLAYVRATIAVLKEMLVDNAHAVTASAEEMAVLFEDGLYGIDQISELVLTLKNFTRLDQARVGEFSVEEGLDSSLLLARYTIKHIAEVQKHYAGVSRISCSPAQINQVFLNIIVNGAHAMVCREGKGLLEVSTSEDKGFVVVRIKDNGHGIPAHVLPQIFDPFFTTKKIGEGSGTGLALAYRIVESHGGRIEVDTEDGVGTVFTISLPIENAQGAQVAPPASAQAL